MVSNGINKVLVTGASGMVGRQVVAALQGTSYGVVRAQVRDRLKAREKCGDTFDFALAEIQASDFSRMLEQDHRELSKGCNVVIHCAGLTHQPNLPYQEYEVVNVRATQALAEACAANRVHTLIFMSSSSVYGPGPFSNVPETAPSKAKTPYAVSKAASETFLKDLQGVPRIIVLRPSIVFGEGDSNGLIHLIQDIKHSKYKHIGDAAAGKSLIYTKDMARVVLLCLQRVKEGYHVFNVANPEPVTVHDLAEEIARCLQMHKKIPSVPAALHKLSTKAASLFGKGGDNENTERLTTETTCSVAKLVQVTGFRPRGPIGIGLKAEINWAQANNLI